MYSLIPLLAVITSLWREKRSLFGANINHNQTAAYVIGKKANKRGKSKKQLTIENVINRTIPTQEIL